MIYWGQYTYQKMHSIVIYPWHVCFGKNGLCDIIFSCGGKEVCYFGRTTLAQQCKTSHVYSTFSKCDLLIMFLNISMQFLFYINEIVIYSIFQLKSCKKLFRTIFFHHLKRLASKGKWWYSMHHGHGCLTWFAKKSNDVFT